MLAANVEITFYALLILVAVIAVVQIVKESRITAAENAERGRRRVIQEDLDICSAQEWLKVALVCPDCKTADGRRCYSDGVVQLIQEYTEVRYNYCHDPFKWHAAHSAMYGGTTKRDALIKIGQRLRRA
jgi:hypothetical protein